MTPSKAQKMKLLWVVFFLVFGGPCVAQNKTVVPAETAQDQRTQQVSQAGGDASSSWRPVIEAARPAVVVIRTDKGQGSGFLIKSDGTIATNAHVITGASTIEVKLASGEVYRRVYILASDEAEDIALLRIEAADVPALPLSNSNDAKVGDNVVLVGAPLGLEETVSTGIVSGTRILESGLRVIQTTAPASPGSSGGPLLNNKGEVIGLISRSAVQGQNLNFAIPINYVRGKLDTLVLSTAAPLMDSTGKTIPGGPGSNGQKHSGVILAGLGGPGTPLGSFEFIFVQLLDFLSAKGVDVMNETATFKPSETLASLNYYLEHLPTSGASGLLYMIVEHPYNNKYTIRIQLFDAKGKQLWEEKETHAGWSETGATNGALEKIEKKLVARVGGPSLLLRQDSQDEAKEQHKN
jgi:S1-C subfamily serine protease